MKGKVILLSAVLVFAYLPHLVSGLDFEKENFDVIAIIIENHLDVQLKYTSYNDDVEQLAGKSVEVTGEVDLDGYINGLTYAYHLGYPADPDYWGPAFTHVKNEYFIPFQIVRKGQQLWDFLINYNATCSKALEERKRTKEGAFSLDIDNILEKCLDKDRYFRQDLLSTGASPGIELLLNVMRLNAVFMLAAEYNFMLYVDDKYGFEDAELMDTYAVRLGPINRMADEANLDHYEITRRIKEFQELIVNPGVKLSPDDRKFIQGKLDGIKDELQNPPFDWIYSNGDDGPVDLRRDCNNHLKQEFENNFPFLVKWIETDEFTRALQSPDVGVDWDFDFPDIMDLTKKFYEDYFKVEYNSTTKEWIWDWDVQDPNTCAKFVRDSWERLDKILEKLKCYMGESYYFSEGIRKMALQLTQLDLTESKLFSNISTTLFKPCRITDDSDLVSTCTRQNHEICAPMFFYRSIGQDSSLDTHGGISLLRPKAYYKVNESSKECQPVKAFIVPYKMCQCGFRMDCGNDLGGNLTCRLTADFLRKQCRGSTAYPCKSLPLAPGRYHESCLSGYCDIEMNSCEDGPPSALLRTSRGYYLKINYWLIAISMISVMFSLKIQYAG